MLIAVERYSIGKSRKKPKLTAKFVQTKRKNVFIMKRNKLVVSQPLEESRFSSNFR